MFVQTQLVRSRHRGVDVLEILDTVSRDAEIYFGVIASSHLVVVIMFAAARVRLFAPRPS